MIQVKINIEIESDDLAVVRSLLSGLDPKIVTTSTKILDTEGLPKITYCNSNDPSGFDSINDR